MLAGALVREEAKGRGTTRTKGDATRNRLALPLPLALGQACTGCTCCQPFLDSPDPGPGLARLALALLLDQRVLISQCRLGSSQATPTGQRGSTTSPDAQKSAARSRRRPTSGCVARSLALALSHSCPGWLTTLLRPQAASSLHSCPIPFAHPDDALQLKGVGPKIVDFLVGKMRDKCEKEGLPMPDRSASSLLLVLLVLRPLADPLLAQSPRPLVPAKLPPRRSARPPTAPPRTRSTRARPAASARPSSTSTRPASSSRPTRTAMCGTSRCPRTSLRREEAAPAPRARARRRRPPSRASTSRARTAARTPSRSRCTCAARPTSPSRGRPRAASSRSGRTTRRRRSGRARPTAAGRRRAARATRTRPGAA